MKDVLEKEIETLTTKRDSLLEEIAEAHGELKRVNILRLNSEQFMRELAYRESNIIRFYEQAGLVYPGYGKN